MERFFKKKSIIESEPHIREKEDNEIGGESHGLKRSHTEFDLANLSSDPGQRKPITEYDYNIRDEVRRAYLQKGPCQPRGHTFKQTMQGNVMRRFCPSWFDEYPTWLEYSIVKEAAYCLCCYLFKMDSKRHADNADAFVVEGFSNWKRKEKLREHVGGPNSTHNKAWSNCQVLMNQQQHIRTFMNRQTDQARANYRIRLTASLDCIHLLLRQGLAFRGHDESKDSNNQGNFLEIHKFLCEHNEEIKQVALDKCPGNLKLTSSDIQKEITHACAVETTKIIVQELKDSFFSILVDEARDASNKEQMAVVVRFVDKKGQVIERFLGIVQVSDTTALSLKGAIEELFSKYSLSILKLRGQGYDGASNMQGKYNGLKALILKENKNAFYIHCFAHQLQLALVGVARKNISIDVLFTLVSDVVNIVGGSCKRRDILIESRVVKVFEALETGELLSGRGQNQESNLKRPGDTRWSSYYNTLISLIKMFSSVIDMLELVMENTNYDQKAEASRLLESLQSFDMIFGILLMKNILGIATDLSQALQRKDQDIVNAMNLVKIAKTRLQCMRENGWSSLLNEVSLFCVKHDIVVLNMDDVYVVRGRSRRNVEKMTNMHHYQVDLFYTIIDLQLQELNNRFNEVATELLICIACLSPMDSFSAFDKKLLIRLAELYSDDFSEVEVLALEDQLETYIIDIKSSEEFKNLVGINDLAMKLVSTKRHILYQLVYRLITLALILPISTATVERAFSAMNIVKNRLRNRIGDQFLADCLITYIEKDIFNSVDNETIIHYYQNMKTRREQL